MIVNFCGEKVETGVKKFGARVGEFGDIGCNTVMNHGSVIGRGANVYPLEVTLKQTPSTRSRARL